MAIWVRSLVWGFLLGLVLNISGNISKLSLVFSSKSYDESDVEKDFPVNSYILGMLYSGMSDSYDESDDQVGFDMKTDKRSAPVKIHGTLDSLSLLELTWIRWLSNFSGMIQPFLMVSDESALVIAITCVVETPRIAAQNHTHVVRNTQSQNRAILIFGGYLFSPRSTLDKTGFCIKQTVYILFFSFLKLI